jgi:hypothetical protein
MEILTKGATKMESYKRVTSFSVNVMTDGYALFINGKFEGKYSSLEALTTKIQAIIMGVS